MVGNITFLMIFAVFDLSPLTLWINQFLVLICFTVNNIMLRHSASRGPSAVAELLVSDSQCIHDSVWKCFNLFMSFSINGRVYVGPILIVSDQRRA